MGWFSPDQLTKRFWLVDLPLMGFLAGGGVALSVHALQHLSLNDWARFATLYRQPLSKVTRSLCAPTAQPTTAKRFWATLARCPSPTAPLQPQGSLAEPTARAGLRFLQQALVYDQLRHPATQPPPFVTSMIAATGPTLTRIVADIVAELEAQAYPTAAVSISLVDLTGDCCDYAGYQDQQPRYPASIVKLFWLVALYGHYEAGILQPDVAVTESDELLMAHYSNNGASSRIVDALTQTVSGDRLEAAALTEWVRARQMLNGYFLAANYPDLNIAHKTFPIPDLEMTERRGRDLQLTEPRVTNQALAARNHLTTWATARLLYEIATGQAVAPTYRDRLKTRLRHSTDPAVWQAETDNAIDGFFGEYLPPDVQLYTKLGFTFDDGRQEAAIIASPDGQTRFILVVFANDPAYSGEDVTVFPEIARTVYRAMQQRHSAL